MKEVLPPYQSIINAPMTGTSTVISSPSNILYKDSVAIQLQWTGTPQGTFYIEGSIDYNAGPNGVVNNPGTWIPLTLSPTPAAAGSASQILLNLNQLGFPWIRTRYVNASGSGTLNGYISGKSLG